MVFCVHEEGTNRQKERDRRREKREPFTHRFRVGFPFIAQIKCQFILNYVIDAHNIVAVVAHIDFSVHSGALRWFSLWLWFSERTTGAQTKRAHSMLEKKVMSTSGAVPHFGTDWNFCGDQHSMGTKICYVRHGKVKRRDGNSRNTVSMETKRGNSQHISKYKKTDRDCM